MGPSKHEKTITWLQISDLHMFESNAITSLHQSIRDHFHNAVDFLVVTGDLHQYERTPLFGIGNYKRSIVELESLMDCVGLKDKENLFMVPGNHDAVTSSKKASIISALDERCATNADGYLNDLKTLEASFSTYEKFLKRFYGEGDFYDSQNIHNHTQLWNDSAEILHLNTALACDGNNTRYALVNLMELSEIERKKLGIPLIVIAHHSFYKIHPTQQPDLKRHLARLGANVYLCGDYHRESREDLSLRNESIPLFVCGKSAIDPSDFWSNVCVILYQWHLDKPGWPVDVRPYRWNEQNPRLEPILTFVDTATMLERTKQDQFPYYTFPFKPDEYTPAPVFYPEPWEELSKKAERRIKEMPLFPWLPKDSPSFSQVYEKLYVEPIIRDQGTEETMILSAFLSRYKEKGYQKLWVLGDAGIGKSTLLKYLFLESQNAGIPCLYIPVTALFYAQMPGDASYLLSLLDGSRSVPSGLQLFLDGIDEAFSSQPKVLPDFLAQVEDLPCEVWLGCRSRFFEDMVRETYFHRILLPKWEDAQIDSFVSRYFDEDAEVEAHHIYNTLCQKQPYIRNLGKNPFHLSLLLFLIKNCGSQVAVDNLYALYDAFFNQCMKKESLRNEGHGDLIYNVYEELRSIARCLYDGNEPTVIPTDPSVLSLLVINPLSQTSPSIQAFYHRSFLEFILAHAVIEAMNTSPEQLIEILRKNHRSDVNMYIKAFFSTVRTTQKNKMIDTMIHAYQISKLAGVNLTENEHFYVENQIVYYITRIPGKSASVQTFIKEIYPKETRAIMRQAIAYGAANMGLLDIGLEFAKKMDPGSNEDITNRSWTLVFYGDKPNEDPLHYEDDGEAPWERSKNARLRRLQSDGSKDRAFRMFDLRILLGFWESRHWQDLSPEDLNIIKACETEIPGFPAEVTDFLTQAKDELVRNFEKYLAI